jgi:hypothetical protein
MSATRHDKISVGALWILALVGAGFLAYRRYHALEGVVPTSGLGGGGDFWSFLHASRQIAAGHGPYHYAEDGYLYTPLIAIALLPFSQLSTTPVWHAWTAVSITALVLFAGLVTLVDTPGVRAWRRPVLFGFAALTVLEFAQTRSELSNGQADAFVAVALAGSVVLAERGWAASSGALIGVGGLLKTWPAAVALVMLRRGYARRRRAFFGLVITLILGPVLAAAVGGASGFADFFRLTFDARSQNLISFSVWTMPRVLFSHTGLAHPLLVSAPVRDLATLVLAAWVVSLLVLTLHWNDSAVLSFWNVVGCVVLLLPVSHDFYTLYFLPILWIWASRWLANARLAGPTALAAGLLVLWWLVLFHKNWAAGSATVSSLRFSIIFFANLAAVTVSVLCDHVVGTGVVAIGSASDGRSAVTSNATSADGSRSAAHRSMGAPPSVMPPARP